MPADAPPKIKVRQLSLTQLQRLAHGGSRRARAELERRMAAVDARSRPVPHPGDAAAPPHRASSDNHAVPPPAVPEAQVLRLQALARQDEARQRAEGPPGLMGLVLMAWGVLLLLGGLALFTRKGGLYYVLCGLACAAIGGLLLRCRRVAIWTHLACIAVALPWAWRGYAGNTFIGALVQSAPIWVAALWIAVPAVREPLN